MSLFLIRPTTESNEITHEKKSWTHEIRTRTKFGPTKHSQRHEGTMELNARDPRWHATNKI